MHPFILDELACGKLKNRSATLSLLAVLPMIKVATGIEVLHLIESRKLMGKGIGYVDVHLLASLILSLGIKLHTCDLAIAISCCRIKIGRENYNVLKSNSRTSFASSAEYRLLHRFDKTFQLD